MKKATILPTATAALLATVAMFGAASYAKDDPVAQNVPTPSPALNEAIFDAGHGDLD